MTSKPNLGTMTRAEELKKIEDSMKEILDKLQAQEQCQSHLKNDLAALNIQQNQIMMQLQTRSGEERGGGVISSNRSHHFSTRQTRVDFPHFNGEDLKGWIYRCNQFFQIDQTPPDLKVQIATINFEGRALHWHQNRVKYKEHQGAVTWNELVLALEDRFGDKVLGSPMAELLALKQTGTVLEYYDQFEYLLGRVSITEEYAIEFFLCGLKPIIQNPVRMFLPQSLHQAVILARLQESTAHAVTREPNPVKRQTPILPLPSSKPEMRGASSSNSKRFSSNDMTNKVRSSSEFDEKRVKGLCFWCDEKYTPGHRCNKKQLYLVEVDDLEDNLDEEDLVVDLEEPNPHISVHALTGIATEGYKTMRVTVFVAKKPLHILIDSGSTHNFLDLDVAKKLGCKIMTVNTLKVDVANGNSLPCTAACKDLAWTLQGSLFTTDVLLLKLGSCDMVLGIQWLATLGDIKWNFSAWSSM